MFFVNLSLLGGGKKRKKKQYTGPKKQKHVRKKVKLGVLKLYKVIEFQKNFFKNYKLNFRLTTMEKSVVNA